MFVSVSVCVLNRLLNRGVSLAQMWRSSVRAALAYLWKNQKSKFSTPVHRHRWCCKFRPDLPMAPGVQLSAPRRALFASLYSAVSTGAFYSFGLYSNALKRQFHLSQQELVNINTIPYMVSNHRAHA